MTDTNDNFVDVLIVGAGLSGIGAACYLRKECKDRSFAILEARETMGGTWDLFRYPGIRSDSDMYTLGYTFKPWTNPKSIADGPSILSYIKETAAEYDITSHVRFQHKVVSADFCSEDSTWTVKVAVGEAGEIRELRCNFFYLCSGYYNYDQGYTPEFKGSEDFTGTLVHAQHWPEELDYNGKKVVVIGSGATAVTLVPEMSKKAASTTMLQRTPTYIASVPSEDPWAKALRGKVPAKLAYHVTRWKRVIQQMYVFNLSKRRPKDIKNYLLNEVRKELGPDYDVKKHFTPDYNPWDQRLCAVPDSDMFQAIREERASVVTDHIDHFDATGIALKSGDRLDADIVVLATGLNLLFMGGAQLSVDGKAVVPKEHFVYRGMMLSDVPNMVQTIGYTNSSWTLKADLTAEYVCRMLNHMTKSGTSQVTASPDGKHIEEQPLLDFSSGYVTRSIAQFPKQGTETPWRVYQNYFLDLFSLRFSSLRNGALKFR
jgi:monooxygenase